MGFLQQRCMSISQDSQINLSGLQQHLSRRYFDAGKNRRRRLRRPIIQQPLLAIVNVYSTDPAHLSYFRLS